jgi:hypothetical protein
MSVTYPMASVADVIDMWNRDFPIAPANYLAPVTVQYYIAQPY